jgi:hypothetical protein
MQDDSRMIATAATGADVSSWVPVIAAAVGAGSALIVGILTQLSAGHREDVRWSRERQDREEQWRRERQDREEQWGRERQDRLDDALRVAASDFVAAARELLHLSRRLERSSDKDTQQKRIDDVHVQLRSLNGQIRLLANPEVQHNARLVVHHAYAVRAVIAEKKPDERLDAHGKPVEERYQDALEDFYRAVRKQLGVPEAESLSPSEILPGDPWDKTREKTGKKTSTTATTILPASPGDAALT